MARYTKALTGLACGLGVLAAIAGAGVAHAQPDPSQPVVPAIIDQLITSTPALSVNPNGNRGQVSVSGDVGMVCQNLTVRCR
ncbi:hypothetical protein [Mycobacterium sp. NPDC004974]